MCPGEGICPGASLASADDFPLRNVVLQSSEPSNNPPTFPCSKRLPPSFFSFLLCYPAFFVVRRVASNLSKPALSTFLPPSFPPPPFLARFGVFLRVSWVIPRFADKTSTGLLHAMVFPSPLLHPPPFLPFLRVPPKSPFEPRLVASPRAT